MECIYFQERNESLVSGKSAQFFFLHQNGFAIGFDGEHKKKIKPSSGEHKSLY